jgi:hypothetical protein
VDGGDGGGATEVGLYSNAAMQGEIDRKARVRELYEVWFVLSSAGCAVKELGLRISVDFMLSATEQN